MESISQKYQYDFPRPAFSADIVVFTYLNQAIKVLLIERGNEPFKNCWAFPGGFVDENELVLNAAERELMEETGLRINNLELFYVASGPERDPRGWTISAIFMGFINWKDAILKAGDDASKAKFYSLNDIPQLAFDHGVLLGEALKYLKKKTRHLVMDLRILPEKFGLHEIESLFFQITGSDKEAKLLAERSIVNEIIFQEEKDKLFRFDYRQYQQLLEFGS
jgi:8-oxo-dGTP diphosphatase